MKIDIKEKRIVESVTITFESKEELEKFRTILLWADSWTKQQVNPKWLGRMEIEELTNKLTNVVNDALYAFK